MIGEILAEGFPVAASLKGALRAVEVRGLSANRPVPSVAFYYFDRYPIEVL
jgi:hypothetical protein